MRRTARILAASLTVMAAFSPLTAAKFTLAIIPDTQKAVEKWPERVDEIAKYIVRMRDSLGIAYVLHMGDLVEHGDNRTEWTRFSGSMKILEDAGIPYILDVGNHDFDLRGVGTEIFNEFFPATRIQGEIQKGSATWGGSYPEGKNTNSYHLFRAGGIDWVVLSVKFNPAPDEMAWAGSIADKYPQRKVIVITHSFLNPDGTRTTDGGARAWDGFIRSRPNIFMVYSGHLVTTHSLATGDNGNTVYQICYDFQGDNTGNNAFFGLATIDPDNRKMVFRSHDAQKDTVVTRTDWTGEFNNVFQYDNVTALGPKSTVLWGAGERPSLPGWTGNGKAVRIFTLDGRQVGSFDTEAAWTRWAERAARAGRGSGTGRILLARFPGGEFRKVLIP